MIYLDNNATTKVHPEVLDAMLPYLREEYGNPSSKYYTKANNAKKAVEEARKNVASLIKCKEDEIIFTSGSSESNNLIIKGYADYCKYYSKKGNHLITSQVEHKSVIQTFKFLNGEVFNNQEESHGEMKINRGYDIDLLKVNKYGQVESNNLINALKESTILVSIIWGNNEIASLNDIKKLSKIVSNKGIKFHTDATQVLGKLDINSEEIDADFMSFSAHKLKGPKGIGAAYIKQDKYIKEKLTSLIHGGSQEYNYRAGTLAVPNIVGFGKAAEIASRNSKEKLKRINTFELELRKALKNKFEDIEFINAEDHLPGSIPMIIPNVFNELYIKRLSDKIAISSGSACSVSEGSYVLKAIGRNEQQSNFIRLSINEETVENHSVDEIIDLL
ncbi:MAG: cysteine desulfurase family protein [Bacillota bacterium]|nr:cysteine desulfurase family protein [Bacillota bacterium]